MAEAKEVKARKTDRRGVTGLVGLTNSISLVKTNGIFIADVVLCVLGSTMVF